MSNDTVSHDRNLTKPDQMLSAYEQRARTGRRLKLGCKVAGAVVGFSAGTLATCDAVEAASVGIVVDPYSYDPANLSSPFLWELPIA